VAANDVDPVALEVAAGNAAANGVALELHAEPPQAIPGPFDVVVANILSNTLVELAPALAGRLAPGGLLLLAGILVPQEKEVGAACLAAGLAPRPELCRREGEWSLLALSKSSGRQA
jgi:ribosomal protein L11 methyltransferase